MKALETMIQNMFHKDCAACTDQEVYEALLTYTKEQLAAKGYHDGKKKIYYISAEFLIGKLLSNNLINLGTVSYTHLVIPHPTLKPAK